MKQKLMVFAAITTLAVCTSTSRADTYADPTGDTFPVNGILDITSVEVTNTATDMIFTIKLAGNPVATDWGKYMIGIQVTNGLAGDTAGNGWARPISVATDAGPIGGINYWVGSWADGGNGAELRNYNAAWALQSATYNPNPDAISFTKTTNSVTVAFSFAGLGAAFGDTIYFDVYSSGGGGSDSAVDALSRSDQSIANWGDAFVSTNLSPYKLQVVTQVPHTVSFAVDMGVQIWEFNNPHPGTGGGAAPDGFDPVTDTVFVRGNFNGFGGTDQLIQEGTSTIYTNTVTFLATPGDTIQYKFQGVSFPDYEQPAMTAGANRTLTLTNTTITLPVACFGDRCLTDPPISTVSLAVDMSVAKRFGVFDPNVNGVSLPGNFNGWNTTAFPLTAGAAPNDNVYTNTLIYYYYPIGAPNTGFYKFYINNLVNDYRDNGWEQPIGLGGGNRSFGINSVNQTLAFTYNDENPVINASIQPLNASDVRVSFNSFPSRGGLPGYPTGGVYAVESATSLSGPWTTNGIIYSTTANSSFTNTGVLPGTPQQFYRVGLIGL
jgi:hypothetical protein